MLVSSIRHHLHMVLLESAGDSTEIFVMTLRYYGSYRSVGLAFQFSRVYAFLKVMSAVVTAQLRNVVYSINFGNQIYISTGHIWLYIFILSPFGRCMHFHCVITDKIQLYNFNHLVTVGQSIK